MSVIISKNKVTGLEEAACTQPKDAVPLSLFQDLSAYVHDISGFTDISNIIHEINDLSSVVYDLSSVVYDLSSVVYDLSQNVYFDISNIQTQLFDLSYYVYNDLSSGSGGTINIGIYSDTSFQIYPNIDTLLFDASNFSLDVSGTIIKIDVSAGSGGGTGDVTFADLSYYFFDKPVISTDCSSYSTSSQNITVKWQPPSQTKAAFNFTTTSNTSADEYNYLPFINDLIVGYQESGSSTWNDFTYSTDVINANSFAPVKVNQLDVTNTGSLPVTKSVVANGSNAKINLNLTSNAIGKSYQFRIAYTNNSEDTNWNYLYCPSGSYIPFGNPGPALPPSLLTINSPSYTELDVGGSGGQYMDSSLNLPWGTQVVKIGYGLDVSGQRSNNSVQVGGFSTNQFTFDVSLGWWNGSNYYLQNWSTSQDNFAYPEYLYNNVANTYYAVNSAEDFSRTQIYYTGLNKADGVIIPSRSTVTSDYDSFLNGSLNASNNDGYTTYNARRRDNYNLSPINNIYFLGDNSGINFTDNNSYKLAANYGAAKTVITTPPGDLNISFVEINSMLGNTCSGEEICYIESKITANSTTFLDLSSTPRVGFTGQDSITLNSNNNMTLLSSATKEEGTGNIRKEGYYLGFDLSNVKLRDISLGILPDICNNSYQPYEWDLTQYLYKSNGLTETESLTPFSFNLAKKPEQNTDLSNISISVINPTLTGTAKFYGLALPTNSSDDLKFPVSFTINNLDPTWAPSDATSVASLYDVSLVYDPNGQTSYSNGVVDRQNSSWVPSATNETYTPSITDLMVDYTGTTTSDYNNFKYSRDISGTNYGAGEQFKISINLRNNVTLSPTNSQSYIVSNDLSGNGKAWWWDFTWDIGYVNTPTQTQPPTSVFGTLPNNTTITLVKSLNPYSVSFANTIPSVFAGTDIISYETAMWGKDGWFGDSSANIPFESKEYPYIDYNNFYGVNEDYSVYDGSGVTQSIIYNNVNIFNSGIVNVTENNLKWVIFKIYRQQSGTNKLTWKATTEVNGTTYPNTLSRWQTDYIVFYMEEDDTGASAYNVSGQSGQQSYTPWLDVQNIDTNASSLTSFLAAQPGGTNNGCNAASTAGAGTGQIQRFRSGATNFIYQYLAFGLKQGVKLKGIEVSYV